VLDAISDCVNAGDDAESVAEDYGYPVEFVYRVARLWNSDPEAAWPPVPV
jgi:hypothetical protein